ncbi:HDOD domain-containing protein [Robertmurraya korlensis]|uniref:EAL and HDOD domain-containing protein n=1 Tax=Robertmurraya korlensis TaxID=519977 RepID=UPI00203DE6CE|nr:HDOD domain-containing protein [Robertmurraya korlensis]MCM3599950.1 HDOD domain-containing protein [Robertmurraya korlensis]
MEVFVARQPIFNQQEGIFAYELLYRNNHVNEFPNVDGDQATTELIINSFLNIGIDALSEGRPCFINFTEKLLDMKLPSYVSSKNIVVELVETTRPSRNLLEILKEMKKSHYKIAINSSLLDELNPYSNIILEQADFIKVDFQKTDKNLRQCINKKALNTDTTLIAEKIETNEEYLEAKSSGYSLFQGYYFAKPAIFSTFDIPACFTSYVDMRAFISKEKTSVHDIVDFIERDPSLSYKILKLINSPANKLKEKIYHIRQAVEQFGPFEIENWIYVLAAREELTQTSSISLDVAKLCLTRGRLCEEIGRIRNGQSEKIPGYFMTGIFSFMNGVKAIPIEKMIDSLPVNEEMVQALMGVQNEYKDVLDLAVAVEKAQWKMIGDICKKLEIMETDLFKLYAEAINWSNRMVVEDICYL